MVSGAGAGVEGVALEGVVVAAAEVAVAAGSDGMTELSATFLSPAASCVAAMLAKELVSLQYQSAVL